MLCLPPPLTNRVAGRAKGAPSARTEFRCRLPSLPAPNPDPQSQEPRTCKDGASHHTVHRQPASGGKRLVGYIDDGWFGLHRFVTSRFVDGRFLNNHVLLQVFILLHRDLLVYDGLSTVGSVVVGVLCRYRACEQCHI